MAFRGRGRGGYGRGGGGSFGYAKQEPFLLFPEIENLPDAKSVTEEMALVLRSSRLQKFWNSSVYYLKDEGQKGDEITDIERFSDRGKRRTEQKHKLTDFIKCSFEYVPAELAQDSKSELNGPRKVRWNQESDLLKLDIFEKREQKHQQIVLNLFYFLGWFLILAHFERLLFLHLFKMTRAKMRKMERKRKMMKMRKKMMKNLKRRTKNSAMMVITIRILILMMMKMTSTWMMAMMTKAYTRMMLMTIFFRSVLCELAGSFAEIEAFLPLLIWLKLFCGVSLLEIKLASSVVESIMVG